MFVVSNIFTVGEMTGSQAGPGASCPAGEFNARHVGESQTQYGGPGPPGAPRASLRTT